MIKEANVTLMVADMKRSIEFYTEVLGLRLKANYGDQFAQVEAPGVVIAIHPASRRQADAGQGSISIGFGVANLQDTMRELEGKGVKFSGTNDDAQVKLAYFSDPDGNQLYLSQGRWG